MGISVLLAILFPVVSVLLFKEFEKQKIDALPAIVFNYLGAIIIGLFLFVTPTQLIEFHEQDWFYSTLIIGFLFILNFYLIAKTAISHGVSIATFANKISLVFPVVFTILYFNESINWLKISGISLALISIYLLTFKGIKKSNTNFLLYPIFIFIFTGIMESVINYTQKIYFTQEGEIGYFVISAFSVSFLMGILVLIFKRNSFKLKNIVGGLILSVSNTFGLYFFVKALNQNQDSTSILSIMNIGTLLLAILVGYFIYQEKLTKKNWLGVFLSIIAIFLLTYF